MNGSTACYQHCLNGINMCVQNQWAFLKVEILNGFKWSISRRVKGTILVFGNIIIGTCILYNEKYVFLCFDVFKKLKGVFIYTITPFLLIKTQTNFS